MNFYKISLHLLLQSITNDRINLRVKVFLVNNFNNNNKEEKVINVIVKGLLPKRHGGVKSPIFC